MANPSIDPYTGKPYAFWDTDHSGVGGYGSSGNPWAMQGTMTGGSDPDRDSGQQADMFGAFFAPDLDPKWLESLGYGQANQFGGYSPLDQQDLNQWLKDKGLTLGMGMDRGEKGGADNWNRLQAFDKDRNPVGSEHRWLADESDPVFGAALGGMAAFMGNFGLAASALGGGAAGAAPSGYSMAGANGQLLNPASYAGLESGLGGGAGLDAAASAALAGQSAPGAGLAAAGGMGAASGLDAAAAAALAGQSSPGAGLAAAGAMPGVGGTLAGAGLLDVLKAGGSGLLDWAKANPSQALKLGGLLGGGLLGALGSGGGGSGGGAAYTPKMMGGNFKTSYTPQFQAVQQQTGLLGAPQGNKSSGLWQFTAGGNPQMTQSTNPYSLLDPSKTTQPVTPSPWSY
jgi:hypothetical protein